MNTSIKTEPRAANESSVRLLVLGAVYAGAVFFSIALSPAIGFQSPSPDSGKIASAETAQIGASR